jgi:hypothetical protein
MELTAPLHSLPKAIRQLGWSCLGKRSRRSLLNQNQLRARWWPELKMLCGTTSLLGTWWIPIRKPRNKYVQWYYRLLESFLFILTQEQQPLNFLEEATCMDSRFKASGVASAYYKFFDRERSGEIMKWWKAID